MNRKIIAVQKLPTIFLKPGEVHFGRDPARVITVLGSCVSVIMYHRHTMIGAICHAVMPSRRGAGEKEILISRYLPIRGQLHGMDARPV